MIFEDVHWIDPTSLEALGRGIGRIKAAGVLLIITHRPEFEPPWLGRPYVTALSLNRLGERDIASMIDRVIGNKALPTKVRQDIIERTDGIPLFVEEMTKAVLEAGAEDAAERAVAAIPSSSIAVPESLHASLMARLDRLGHAKEVAQIAAAIGREFLSCACWQRWCASRRRNSIRHSTASSRLVCCSGRVCRRTRATLFKHALVQDAAYGTRLRDARRGLHARIAETLEGKFIDIAENQPELLACHRYETPAPHKKTAPCEGPGRAERST